ncbi:MAG: hypothetical protein Harvfovirus5_54 [Harvfovirus sp.]|uniref:Uncharacterized protein n=1 Tax=Harvfovirus sp. TaxID=2487768 RepID=A0A3G5A0U1_9VIRU|nr:MAG: hypothetical protein Harvfovirus5_54 [Harvfovirus sp.]
MKLDTSINIPSEVIGGSAANLTCSLVGALVTVIIAESSNELVYVNADIGNGMLVDSEVYWKGSKVLPAVGAFVYITNVKFPAYV